MQSKTFVEARAMMHNKRWLGNCLIGEEVFVQFFNHGAASFLKFEFKNTASFHVEKIGVDADVFDVDFALHTPAALNPTVHFRANSE